MKFYNILSSSAVLLLLGCISANGGEDGLRAMAEVALELYPSHSPIEREPSVSSPDPSSLRIDTSALISAPSTHDSTGGSRGRLTTSDIEEERSRARARARASALGRERRVRVRPVSPAREATLAQTLEALEALDEAISRALEAAEILKGRRIFKYTIAAPSDSAKGVKLAIPVEGGHAHEPMTLEIKDEDAKCLICWEEYIDRAEIGMLKCGHHGDQTCLAGWLQVSPSCPMCRRRA